MPTSPPSTPWRRGTRALGVCAVLAAASLTLAACAAEPPGYEGPYRSKVREAIVELEESSGLPFKRLPVLEERSRDQVREFLERQFTEQLTPLEIAGTQEAYRRFGLLSDTLDLRVFLLDLLTEQVAGYYDPATKVLYVVKDASPDIRDITITHELMHALQDQHTPLDSVQSLEGDNDRVVAMQAVVEGQAVYEQLAVMVGGDIGLRLPGAWDQVREVIRSGQGSSPKFAAAPMLLQETLLFPYINGSGFVRAVKEQRGGGKLYAPFAASTEQVMHPEKYLTDTPDLPTRITLAAPRGGALMHEDNLGEFETRLLLFEHLRDLNTAARAAAGWDGDRYQVVNTGSSSSIGWLSVWDSPVEAAEFRDAMQRAIERRFKPGNGTGASTGVTGDDRRWTAKGRQLRLHTLTIAGRPAVVYEDVPVGAAVGVIRLDQVTLREP